MKIIKLFLIFVLLAGGILLALNWNSVVKPGEKDDFIPADLIDIGRKCDEIRAAWKLYGSWDEDLYQKQRADIDQSKGMGLFSKNGYNAVNNCLRETATVTACNAYLDALHADPLDAGKLAKCYFGVQSVKRHENLTNDARIKNVEDRQTLYDAINAFISKKHIFTPRFDEDKYTWKSFKSHIEGELEKARKYRTNVLYAEMSHDKRFQEGLNEDLLRKKMEEHRQNYYATLSRQIISCFEEKEVTQDNIDSLYMVIELFEKEHDPSDLLNFCIKYKLSKDEDKDENSE